MSAMGSAAGCLRRLLPVVVEGNQLSLKETQEILMKQLNTTQELIMKRWPF